MMQKSNILFQHFPKFLSSNCFELIMDAVKDKIYLRKNFASLEKQNEYAKANGYSTKKRKSCIFSLHELNLWGAEPFLHSYPYSELPPIIEEIRILLEKFTNEIYDYVLVHIYEDGKGSINWHSDREAMKTPIASISFGATRKFRLKQKGKTSGYDHEFKLASGDLFMMYTGCQSKYVHSVPIECKVKEPRINLTFRRYE